MTYSKFVSAEKTDDIFLPAREKDGEPCPYVFLAGPKATRLAGLGLIEVDLEFCLSWVELILELEQPQKNERDTRIIRSLLFATVISYGKCFTSAEGRKVKLEPGSLFKAENQHLAKVHSNIMDVRNNYIAHSGMNEREYSLVLLTLNPDKHDPRPLSIDGIQMSHSGEKPERLYQYRTLISHVLHEVKAMQKKLTATMKKEILQEPIENWYQRARNPVPRQKKTDKTVHERPTTSLDADG